MMSRVDSFIKMFKDEGINIEKTRLENLAFCNILAHLFNCFEYIADISNQVVCEALDFSHSLLATIVGNVYQFGKYTSES